MRPERAVDVLVVGSGAAGLRSALSARENGAQNVLIAESEGLVGGSSRLSGGLMMGAGTRYQRALGIEDDAGSLFHEYMQLNQWKVESAVGRGLAELAGATVWLPAGGGGDRMGLVHRGAGQPRRPPRPRRPGWRAGDGLQPRAAAAARGLREDL